MANCLCVFFFHFSQISLKHESGAVFRKNFPGCPLLIPYLFFGVVPDATDVLRCTAVMGQKYPELFQNASGLRPHHPFCKRMERVSGWGSSCSPDPLTLSYCMAVSVWVFNLLMIRRWRRPVRFFDRVRDMIGSRAGEWRPGISLPSLLCNRVVA